MLAGRTTAEWLAFCSGNGIPAAEAAGQHTREVLAEAGLAEAEIARLEAAGVLSAGPAAGGTPAPHG